MCIFLVDICTCDRYNLPNYSSKDADGDSKVGWNASESRCLVKIRCKYVRSEYHSGVAAPKCLAE